MKIPKSILIDPEEQVPSMRAFAVAVSVFAFAYSTNFGQILILAYYAGVASAHVRRLPAFRAHLSSAWLPLLFVAYVCFSVFWSQAAGTTRAGGAPVFLAHAVRLRRRAHHQLAHTGAGLADRHLLRPALFAECRRLCARHHRRHHQFRRRLRLQEPGRLLRLARHLSSASSFSSFTGATGQASSGRRRSCLLSVYMLAIAHSATSVASLPAVLASLPCLP